MDITTILILAVILVLLIILAGYVSSPESKGKAGEASLRRRLERVPGYKLFFQNCYLPSRNGKTTEIDLIMVHETGVYVFESKNYTGWIFGDAAHEQWLETFPGGREGPKRYPFLNPMIQNELHIQSLKRALRIDGVPYYSYIVFGDACTLKNPDLDSEKHHVLQMCDLLRVLRHEMQFAECQLTPQEIDTIGMLLAPYENTSEEQKQAHQQRIQWEYSEQFEQRNVKAYGPPVCPRCGASLVLRVAKTGPQAGQQFWGCSHYPKCRFIRNL